MDTIKQLKWRYATKQFDSDKKLNTEQLNTLLEAVNLSPTSFGLQQYKVIVVEDENIKEKIRSVAYNQPQITESSQVIIFAIKKNIGDDDVDDFIRRIAETRNMQTSLLAEYEGMMKGKINSSTPEQIENWASKQCYIGLGFLLYTAAQLHIDACPMEGFDPGKVDEILGLEAKGLKSIVMTTVGFRSENDKYQHAPKVRLPIDELIVKY